MKLTADTITTAQTEAIFHSLATAMERARTIMRKSQDGRINPAQAADFLNVTLSTLNLSLAEAIDPAPPIPESLKHDMVEVAAS